MLWLESLGSDQRAVRADVPAIRDYHHLVPSTWSHPQAPRQHCEKSNAAHGSPLSPFETAGTYDETSQWWILQGYRIGFDGKAYQAWRLHYRQQKSPNIRCPKGPKKLQGKNVKACSFAFLMFINDTMMYS